MRRWNDILVYNVCEKKMFMKDVVAFQKVIKSVLMREVQG